MGNKLPSSLGRLQALQDELQGKKQGDTPVSFTAYPKKQIGGVHLSKYKAHYWIRIYEAQLPQGVRYFLTYAWRNQHDNKEVVIIGPVGDLEDRDLVGKGRTKQAEMIERGYSPVDGWSMRGDSATVGKFVEDEDVPLPKSLRSKPRSIERLRKSRAEDAEW